MKEGRAVSTRWGQEDTGAHETQTVKGMRIQRYGNGKEGSLLAMCASVPSWGKRRRRRWCFRNSTAFWTVCCFVWRGVCVCHIERREDRLYKGARPYARMDAPRDQSINRSITHLVVVSGLHVLQLLPLRQGKRGRQVHVEGGGAVGQAGEEGDRGGEGRGGRGGVWQRDDFRGDGGGARGGRRRGGAGERRGGRGHGVGGVEGSACDVSSARQRVSAPSRSLVWPFSLLNFSTHTAPHAPFTRA